MTQRDSLYHIRDLLLPACAICGVDFMIEWAADGNHKLIVQDHSRSEVIADQASTFVEAGRKFRAFVGLV